MKVISARYFNYHIPSRIFRNFTKTKWTDVAYNDAVKDAENVVGYSTSFLNLRWMLSDEVATMLMHMKKLEGTNNSFLSTVRDIMMNKNNPSWGLIVLLVSKMGGLGREFSEMDYDATAGILHCQRTLAETIEMLRISHIIHTAVQNPSTDSSTYDKDVNLSNKLAILGGDYLIASSFSKIAAMKCSKVEEIIESCIRDLAESEFIEPRDRHNKPLPAKPLVSPKRNIPIPIQFEAEDIFESHEVLGDAKREWTLKHLLGGASLLGKFCQSSLILAEHNETIQILGYLFGRNLALAYQARLDHSIFQYENKVSFDLICAPLMFHMQEEPSYYDLLMEDVENDTVDYGAIIKDVRSGSGLRKTLELKEEFATEASSILEKFPESEARYALRNFIKAI